MSYACSEVDFPHRLCISKLQIAHACVTIEMYSLALPDPTRKYSERESGDTSIPNQFFWNVSGRGHVNHYGSRGRNTVPERAAVDAAKELGYDSLKDL